LLGATGVLSQKPKKSISAPSAITAIMDFLKTVKTKYFLNGLTYHIP
jgi:hypothetical protein